MSGRKYNLGILALENPNRGSCSFKTEKLKGGQTSAGGGFKRYQGKEELKGWRGPQESERIVKVLSNIKPENT